MGVVAVVVEAEVAVEVAEERHHLDPEKQDMERLSLPMWTTNCMAKALTFLRGQAKGQRICHPVGPLLESQLQRSNDEDPLHPSYCMLFLTFFKGPLTANWTSVMNWYLNTQV